MREAIVINSIDYVAMLTFDPIDLTEVAPGIAENTQDLRNLAMNMDDLIEDGMDPILVWSDDLTPVRVHCDHCGDSDDLDSMIPDSDEILCPPCDDPDELN